MRYVILIVLAAALLVVGCDRDVPTESLADAYADADAYAGADRAGNGHAGWFTLGWQLDGVYVLNLDTRDGHGTLGAQIDGSYGFAFGYAFDLDATVYSFMSFYEGLNQSVLTTIDLETEIVAPVNIDEVYPLIFAGPDIDSYGNLYVTGFTVGPPEDPDNPAWYGGSSLWHVNKATGEMTEIGDTGYGQIMDLAFDSQDRCWATFGNQLWTVNTETGAATFVTDIHGVPTDDIPNDECPDDWQYIEVMNIAFDRNDALWASAIRGFSPCYGYINAPVMRIDVDTGDATLVGYAETGGQNHGGDIMPTSVTIAHRNEDGQFREMIVSINALAGHLAHGDYVPGTVGDPNYH